MHAFPSDVATVIKPGDAVLVLCPSFATDDSAACTDLLMLDNPANKHVISILLTQSPSDRLAIWKEYTEDGPQDISIIDVRAKPNSATDDVAVENSDLRESFNLRVEQVGSPTDLTTIGVRVTDCLEAWESSTDHQTMVCLESISTLFQYADRQQVFKFLYALINHLAASSCISHCHMDPEAHEAETLEIITELFDVVCEYEENGWTFQRR